MDGQTVQVDFQMDYSQGTAATCDAFSKLFTHTSTTTAEASRPEIAPARSPTLSANSIPVVLKIAQDFSSRASS